MYNRSVVDYGRWKNVWCFLSSPFAQQFSQELWLDFLPQGHRINWIAEKLEPWSSRTEFTHDFGVVHREMFSLFERNHGARAAFELMLWTDYVFINGGSERAAESMWCSVCTKSYHANKNIGPSVTSLSDLLPRVIEVGSVFVQEAKVLDGRLRVFYENSAAEVKPSALVLPDFDRENFRDMAKLITKCNLFCSIWGQLMADVSYEDLGRLYATVKVGSALDFGAGVNPELLGFPGEWAALCIIKRQGRAERTA